MARFAAKHRFRRSLSPAITASTSCLICCTGEPRPVWPLTYQHPIAPRAVFARGGAPDALAAAHRVVRALFLLELSELPLLLRLALPALLLGALLRLDAPELGLPGAPRFRLGLLLPPARVRELLGLVRGPRLGLADRALDAVPEAGVALLERLAFFPLHLALLQLEAREHALELLHVALLARRRRHRLRARARRALSRASPGPPSAQLLPGVPRVQLVRQAQRARIVRRRARRIHFHRRLGLLGVAVQRVGVQHPAHTRRRAPRRLLGVLLVGGRLVHVPACRFPPRHPGRARHGWRLHACGRLRRHRRGARW